MTLLTSGLAHADGLELDLVGARAIGRAGAVVVSGDGGGALLFNPAGIVRRGGWRVQAGMALHDSDTVYDAGGDSPVVRDQAGAERAPDAALVGGPESLEAWVFGVAYLETGDLSRAFPAPVPSQPAAQVARLYPHRYGGLALRYQRRTAVAGAAVRATDWLGVGVSLHASAVELSETRHVWAGFDGRDAVGDPSRDMRLSLGGRDWFVPGATLGVLVAPELPLELAASVSWAMDAALDGDANLATATAGVDVPTPALSDPTSRATLASPLVMRAGARYLGQRFFVEVGAEAALFPVTEPDPTWSVTGVTAVDPTGATGELGRVPSLVDRKPRATVRGAADVEVVAGFLWLTGGYAYATRGQRLDRLAPGHADLGRHTLAAGAETQWEGITLTIGYARSMSRAHTVTGSLVELVNPFDAGTGAAANGRYDAAHDAFAAAVEMAW